MKTLSIDIETYSDVPLPKTGVYRYCESPDFEILLFGYSVDSGPVQVVDLACGEQIPEEIIAALEDESVIKWAFNASFERVCLSRFLGYPTGEYLDPESWRCSMIWAATMGLPLSLEGYSMDRIAKGLEADGILTGAGKTKWWTSTINKILRNEKYIGDALLQKTYTTDFLNKTRVKNNGIVPQYYVEGNHKAIIPKDIFLRVQEELVRRRVVKTSANGKSAPIAATTALHRLSFAANAVKYSAEFTGTIAAANPSSGAASVDWSQPDRNATQEPSIRRY